MRTKKHAIVVSILIAIFSLILAVVTQFFARTKTETWTETWTETLGFFSNMFLGIFGSSIVTLLVYIFEYREKRSIAINAFCKNIIHISDLMDQLVYIRTDNEGQIDKRCLEKRGNKSIVEDLCDKYISIHNLSYKVEELLYEIDFFCDISLKRWWIINCERRSCVKQIKGESNLSKEKKKYKVEEVKLSFRDESNEEGKRKQLIRKKIIEPLEDLRNTISRYAPNEFMWYRDGREDIKKEVIASLIELQSLFFEETKTGALRRERPWLFATYELYDVLDGSKIFWLDN